MSHVNSENPAPWERAGRIRNIPISRHTHATEEPNSFRLCYRPEQRNTCIQEVRTKTGGIQRGFTKSAVPLTYPTSRPFTGWKVSDFTLFWNCSTHTRSQRESCAMNKRDTQENAQGLCRSSGNTGTGRKRIRNRKKLGRMRKQDEFNVFVMK